MSDLERLADLIKDAIADADGDLRAAGRLHGVLLEGLGLSIAYASGGDRTIAIAMCERVSVGVFESATLSACVLGDAGRL